MNDELGADPLKILIAAIIKQSDGEELFLPREAITSAPDSFVVDSCPGSGGFRLSLPKEEEESHEEDGAD
jgi:hypothetical protein